MKRLFASRSTRLLLALMSGLLPVASWSAIDWQLGTGKWTGGVGLSYSQTDQSNKTNNSSTSTSAQRLRETMLVQGTGLYVLDRRLVNANLGLQLDLNQNKGTGSLLGNTGNGSNRLLGYNVDASILEQKPYPMTVFANRSQSQSTQSFGGRTDGTFENRGFSLQLKEDSFLKDWGGPWFSANISARQEQRQDTNSFFGRVINTNQKSNAINITADKGFPTADLRFRYLGLDQVNSSSGPTGSQTQTTNLFYDLDFGPGLNRNLASSLSYTTNNGALNNDSVNGPLNNNTLTLTEALSIPINRNLNTNYSYVRTRNVSGADVTLEQTGNFALTHQLYENLSTSLGLEASHLDLRFGTQSSYGGQLGQSYTHSLPGRGGLSLNWSAGYHRYNNQLSVGLIRLTGEPHTAPPVIDPGFLLERSNVIVSSIQVFNVQTGVRVLLSKVPAGGGVGDYIVVQEGNRVRIEPVYVFLGVVIDPNSPVKPGEPLVVDYDYQVDPSLIYESRNSAYGLSVNYDWIGATYQHTQSKNVPLSGEALFLDSTRDDNVNIFLRGDWRGFQTTATASHLRNVTTSLTVQRQTDSTKLALQANRRVLAMDGQAKASVERYRSTTQDFDLRQLIATLFWRLQYNFDMTFGAAASNLHIKMPERQSTDLSARAALNWNAEDGWRHTAFADARTRNDTIQATQTFFRLGASTQKKWGKLSLSAGLAFDYSLTGASTANSQSFSIAVLRAF